MRFLPLIFLLSFQLSARTYYVKQHGSSGTGLQPETAWSYQKLQNSQLSPGDKVLFQRGDVFFGPLKVVNGVYYGAYGKGLNPVITGFKQVNGWVKHDRNIYVAPLDGLPNLNLVTLNGKVASMGRYPNTGYLQYTGHQGNSGIQGQDVASLPFNAAGAEAVIRKVRWILDRHPVITHRKDLLTLATHTLYGGALSYEGVDKNGFFIQNHLATLDREGEWYYDRAAKKLYMVLAGPAQKVAVAMVEKLVDITQQSTVHFTSIDFTGSNVAGISIVNSGGISLTNCRFYQHGQNGIYGLNTRGLTVSGGAVQFCLNNGIWVEWDGKDTRIGKVKITDCGTIAGAGRSGDAAQQGVFIAGDNTTITGCSVVNSGYNAIQFNGSHARIERNYVDRFCLVKDDGAGIYTYLDEGVQVKDRLVRNNAIFHGVGAYAGAGAYAYEAYGKAAGIYLDGNSNHTEVNGNNVAYGPWAGIFINNNGNNQIIGNTIYGHPAAIGMVASKAGVIRNMVVKHNNYDSGQSLYIKLMEPDDPALFGSFEKNCYQRGKTIVVDHQYKNGGGSKQYNLKEWKAFGIDKGSFY